MLPAVLFSLLLMCAGLGVFMLHQARVLKVQVAQGEQRLAAFNGNFTPTAKRFVAELQVFARNNPDFLPVLAKYNLQPAAQPAPAAPKK